MASVGVLPYAAGLRFTAIHATLLGIANLRFITKLNRFPIGEASPQFGDIHPHRAFRLVVNWHRRNVHRVFIHLVLLVVLLVVSDIRLLAIWLLILAFVIKLSQLLALVAILELVRRFRLFNSRLLAWWNALRFFLLDGLLHRIDGGLGLWAQSIFITFHFELFQLHLKAVVVVL